MLSVVNSSLLHCLNSLMCCYVCSQVPE
jgi:hypothetical protein